MERRGGGYVSSAQGVEGGPALWLPGPLHRTGAIIDAHPSSGRDKWTGEMRSGEIGTQPLTAREGGFNH